jgi:hypothetical protein
MAVVLISMKEALVIAAVAALIVFVVMIRRRL